MNRSLARRLLGGAFSSLVILAALHTGQAGFAAAKAGRAGRKSSKVKSGSVLVQSSAKKMPQWITGIPQDRNFYFFVGTSGDAESYDRGKEEAIDDAISQVVKMIGVTVTSTTTYEERYFAEQYVTTISAELFAEGKAKLQDAEIREIYFEKYARADGSGFFRVWALLKYGKREVEKEQARLRTILEAKYGEVNTLEAKGAEAHKTHRLAEAIWAHLQAALTSLSIDDGELLFTRNMNRAGELLLKVRFEKQGEDQVGFVGEALRSPLRLLAFEEEGGKRYPVPGLPVQFAYSVPKEKSEGWKLLVRSGATGSDGAVEYPVEMVYEVSDANRVEASIDLGAQVKQLQGAPEGYQDQVRAFKELIGKKTAVFTFRSDTKARGIKTAVYFLTEDADDAAGRAAYEVLFDKKFSVKVLSICSCALEGKTDEQALAVLEEKAGAGTKRVIFGRVRVLGYDAVSGYDTAQVLAASTLYDVETGSVIRTWQVQKSGTGASPELARTNAFKEAGKAIGNLMANTMP